MSWFRISTASKVYVLDPARMHVRDAAGRLLSPAELVAGWRRLGTVEQLGPGVDPEAVMRESWRPSSTRQGGNVGMGGPG